MTLYSVGSFSSDRLEAQPINDAQFKISVVIATYNRSDTIPITLEHLATQSLSASEFEVVVVDDGSTDDTGQSIRRLQAGLPYELVYLRHANRGISYTQNRGIRAARAPIICLIADDIHFAPHALQAHLEDHQQNPEPHAAILGKVVQSPKLTQSVFLRIWDPFRFRELENQRELSFKYFFACNISFKKKFVLENGMFDETLVEQGAYAHEDIELGYRLCKKGLRILYNKNALAYHHHAVTFERAMQTAYQKGLNWPEFRRLVDTPELTVRYHVLQPPFLKDYVRVFRKGNGLVGLDSNPFLLAICQLGRVIMFNVLTVPFFWLPIMKKAETSPLIARCMHRLFYRCVISHYFHKGVAHTLRGHIPIEPTKTEEKSKYYEAKC